MNPPLTLTEGIFQAALEISRKRAAVTRRMRKALEEGRNDDALRFARWLCGLPVVLDEEEQAGVQGKSRRAHAANTRPALTNITCIGGDNG